MSARMSTLTVYTTEAGEGHDVWKLLTDIGGELAMNHQSATVSTHKMGDTLDGDDKPEELYHDENTMRLVREAILTAASPFGIGEDHPIVDGIINELQNAGILFRERRK